MFRRRLLPVWIGIIFLSGMFLTGQDPWCTDRDGDGYGDPASSQCPFSVWDCLDDPSGDPPICATCTCVQEDCSPCARCINPGVSEAYYSELICSDGVDNDCDGQVDETDTGCQLDIPASSLNEGGEERESATHRIVSDAIGQTVIGAVPGKSTSETYALEVGSIPSM